MAVPGVEPRLWSLTVTPLTATLFYPSDVVLLLGMAHATPYGCSFIQQLFIELGAGVWGATVPVRLQWRGFLGCRTLSTGTGKVCRKLGSSVVLC